MSERLQELGRRLYEQAKIESQNLVSQALKTAKGYAEKRIPYKWGSKCPEDGLDQSGLIYACYHPFIHKYGIIPEGTMERQLECLMRSGCVFKKLGAEEPLRYAERGDIVFFGNPDEEIGKQVKRVGIATEDGKDDEIRLIFASSNAGHVVEEIVNVSSPDYQVLGVVKMEPTIRRTLINREIGKYTSQVLPL